MLHLRQKFLKDPHNRWLSWTGMNLESLIKHEGGPEALDAAHHLRWRGEARFRTWGIKVKGGY